MNQLFRCFWGLVFLLPVASVAQDFSFTDKEKGVQILYSTAGPKLDSIAAHLLANDLQLLTGSRPAVITDRAQAKGNVIVIGNISAPLIQQFTGKQSSLITALKNKWECFALQVIDTPGSRISKALVVAGSDARGTAYGVFSLSEKLGVSPWYWWADVPVKQQRSLTIQQPLFISTTPRIKFRGIFINDEDWGLQPWAAKTFEPETGDIGPNTYAKVFELLLRLKANLIWPAMHPCTKAFFYYPDNKKVAEDYSIVIGSSHAEPMLRNNVGEWNEKTMGHFNYVTNKEKVFDYWESRVQETTANDVLYSMGMRGVHDSGMEGVKNKSEAVPLLEQIFKDQRDLLSKYRGKPADSIPQVFTAYKEVLDIYDNGLKVPDDITLVWPDDNYGYIHRLNNDNEKKRAGGSGVYYHASYWGRPHDYLWFGTTPPTLMKEELMKALQAGANRLWVLNVGDIKPLEFITDYFFRLAYDPNKIAGSNYRHHLGDWVKRTISKEREEAAAIENILLRFYLLMYERKPEFMGWSRTEPTTQTAPTQYNHFYYGDEAQARIDSYDALEKAVKLRRSKLAGMPAEAAFYQLVYYPVVCASYMNKKFLYRDKAMYYAKQNRLSAMDYAAMSKAAYDSIIKETEYYNNSLAGGKWKNIMSMRPRDLPVFKEPVMPEISIDAADGWGIAPEGFVTKDSSLLGDAVKLQLPLFDNIYRQQYFVDIFLCDKKTVSWTAAAPDWIRLSHSSGSLLAEPGKNQQRIKVYIDWNKAPDDKQLSGKIIFKGNGKQAELMVQACRLNKPPMPAGTAIENNGYICIKAAAYNAISSRPGPFKWSRYDDLGYTGSVLRASLPLGGEKPMGTDLERIKKAAHYVDYDFYTFTPATPRMTVFAVPAHPVNNKYRNRYAVSADDGALTLVDLKTEGRSEEWKRNVLSNRAAKNVQLPYLDKGFHKLRIYCVDPGVMLDEIRIDLGGLKQAYSTLPETKANKK
ncbi:glycosyl hydrolase 115 family protein [Niastella populi]|uniref:Gylcosyl hydrolase 115 C-terminal domain-containing protein n=1 Tax=Niastella populi TaxID=550983 RepID=A0A1V9F2M5_9BACT|nr:glycosyl hydrolase 115 family protein [Niastella populi]OQP52683.1 hypothetical protein A4R26_28430 [Niastella populi]